MSVSLPFSSFPLESIDFDEHLVMVDPLLELIKINSLLFILINSTQQ